MKIRHLTSIILIVILTSCVVSQGEKVTRKHKKLKGMSDAKLYKETVANYLDYQNINFKKISISYEQEGKKQEFRGSVRMLKDSIIWVSISKLGIEGMRMKLTPDSVAFIDRLHRKYMLTDYSYFNEHFNLELDFFLIQRMLTNELPEYRIAGNAPFFRNFKGKKTDKHYIFYSRKRKDKKYWKQREALTGIEGNTLEVLRISPDLMRLESIDIYDTQFFKLGGQQTVNFNLKYSNYKIYNEKYLFPETITATLQRKLVTASEDIPHYEKMILAIQINKLAVNEPNLRFPFSISKKYRLINE